MNFIGKSCWMISRSKKLTFRASYNYLTPIDKPIVSLSLTSIHELSSQLMMFGYIESSICPQLSILIGALAFRLAIEPLCSIVRKMRFENKKDLNMRDYIHNRSHPQDRKLISIIDKVFILDTVRDCQFYGIPKEQINQIIMKYYHPSVFISSGINLYLLLNFLRGAHFMISNPENHQFCQQTIYLLSLSWHDIYFMTPIVIMLVNYQIIKKSRHPLLIHVNHPGNWMFCTNLAFMSGLIFVPAPGVYHFAYLGLGLGHLMIRYGRHLIEDIMRTYRKIYQ